MNKELNIKCDPITKQKIMKVFRLLIINEILKKISKLQKIKH